MRPRITATFLVALGAALTLVPAAGANVVPIWRAGLDTQAQRGQIGTFLGERCRRGGSERAFRVTVGKRTAECAYRAPVVGRDVELSAVGRLLRNTPRPVQRRAFVSLNLRAGENGARYQLAVFPLQRKAQLRKVSSEGRVKYLHIERGVPARGLNQANRLRLRAFNVTRGPEKGNCRIVAFVGGKRVADVTDGAAGELQGRVAGFSVGAVGNAKGAVASFESVVVRVPNPF